MGCANTRKRNQMGQTLVDACNQENWVFTHSWTPQNNKNTWKHPRFKTEHQLDHFITEHRYIRNVNRVLTIHPESIRDPQTGGWEEYTDHKPVEMTVRLAPPAFYKPSQTPARRIAVQRGRGCSDQAVALRNKFHQALEEKLHARPGPVDWQTICEITTTVAADIFGYVERSPPRPWFVGREAEIKQMNTSICALKRSYDHLTELCAQPTATPSNTWTYRPPNGNTTGTKDARPYS